MGTATLTPPQPATDRRERLLPLAALGVTVLLWASAFVAIRHLGDQVSPGPLTLGRCAVATVALGVLLVVRRARSGLPVVRPSRAAWGRLLLIGVLWFGLYNVALNAAEQRVDAGTAAMLVNVGPILIAVLAGVLLGEGFPRQLVVGCLVAFVGVLLIGVATSSSDADLWGVVLCLVAAVAYAVAVVLQKPLLVALPALEVTLVACAIGALCCLPFAGDLWHDLRTADPAHLNRLSATGWVVYLGLMPTAVAFTTWAYALARSTAGRTGSTTYLVPPLAILLGWLLLGETPPVLAVAGGVVCLVGVGLTRRPARGRVAR